jgi:hypothetical protein
MTEDQKKLIAEATVTLELSVGAFGDLVQMLNTPLQVPTMTWATYIDKIQSQIIPQVKKLEDSLSELKATP